VVNKYLKENDNWHDEKQRNIPVMSRSIRKYLNVCSFSLSEGLEFISGFYKKIYCETFYKGGTKEMYLHEKSVAMLAKKIRERKWKVK
jgi:hypothetical protein